MALTTAREDRYILPPNFTANDLFYVVSQGAKVYNNKDGSYLIKANCATLRHLDTLWAIEAIQK